MSSGLELIRPALPLDRVQESPPPQVRGAPWHQSLEWRHRPSTDHIEVFSKFARRKLLRAAMMDLDRESECRHRLRKEVSLLACRLQEVDLKIGACDGDDDAGQASTRTDIEDASDRGKGTSESDPFGEVSVFELTQAAG